MKKCSAGNSADPVYTYGESLFLPHDIDFRTLEEQIQQGIKTENLQDM